MSCGKKKEGFMLLTKERVGSEDLEARNTCHFGGDGDTSSSGMV